MKKIDIQKELNIKPVKIYKEVLDPDMVYIPVSSGINVNNTYVYKDSVIDGVSLPISGFIVNKVLLKNREYYCISNDFKELSLNQTREPLNRDYMTTRLPNLDKIFTSNIKSLYINTIDQDPYIFNKYFMLKNDAEKIINTIEILINTMNLDSVYLVVVSQNEELISEYLNNTTTNRLKLKIVNNYYPIGNPKVLESELNLDSNSKLVDLEFILKIYKTILKRQSLTEKNITINGNALKEGVTLKVKLYTKLSDYFKYIKIKDSNYEIILNNSLCGSKIREDMIITSNLEGVIINKVVDLESSSCIYCGLCNLVCPMHINPLKRNSKCINCGLCNFVCPSKIRNSGDSNE